MARSGLRSVAGVAALLAVAAPARAERAAPLSAWLDADAPVVVSVRPSLLPLAATALTGGRDADDDPLARAVDSARATATAALGVDLLDRDGWLSAGFAPDGHVLASLGAIDVERTAQVFDQLFAAAEWSDAKLRRVRKTFWRHRAVVPLADVKRAEHTVRALATHSARLYAVEPGNASELAMLLGGNARKSKSVEKRLRQRHILAIGWLEGLDAFVALRVLPKRKLLIVDVVGTFAGVPAVWSRDSKKLLGAIERNPGTSKLPATLARGVGDDALAADAAIWIQAEALFAVTKATARNDALRTLALTKPGKFRRRELHRRAADTIADCDALRPLATRGPLLDVALMLDANANGISGRVAWGLRKGNALAAALAVRDDGLLAWPGPNDAALVAAHYLRSLRELRRLPRPKPLRRSFDELDPLLNACGSGASFTVALFGWHALLGLALDALHADEPALRPAIDDAGNGALAVRALGDSTSPARGALAVALEAGGAAALATTLGEQHGDGTLERVGSREVTRWRGAAPQPFSFATASGGAAYGAATGDAALAWFARAAGPSADPPIARWRVAVPALVERFPELPGWLRAVAARLERIDGRVTLERRVLAVELVAHPR